MLEKTIKKVLDAKVVKWLSSIEDNEVKDAIKKDLIITGGCFNSFILNQQPNDFDCYFRTRKTTLLVAQYYIEQWKNTHPEFDVFLVDGNKIALDLETFLTENDINTEEILNDDNRIKIYIPSNGLLSETGKIDNRENVEIGTGEHHEIRQPKEEQEPKKEYRPVFLTSNAISLSEQIQIIVRFFGEVGEIHKTYDFEHAKAYYDYDKKELEIPKEVYELTTNKTLRYTGSLYPVCSLFRIRKFIERGWTINAGQILKIALQVSELDLLDIRVLEDQLIGVDSLFFMSLIDQIKKQKTSDEKFELSSNYLMSIIDKVF